MRWYCGGHSFEESRSNNAGKRHVDMAAFSDHWMCSYTQNRRPLHEDCLVRFWCPWQDSKIGKITISIKVKSETTSSHLKLKRILKLLIKSDQWGNVITGSVFPRKEEKLDPGIKCSDTTGVGLVYWNSELKSGQGHTPISKHRHAMHARVIFCRVGGLLETL